MKPRFLSTTAAAAAAAGTEAKTKEGFPWFTAIPLALLGGAIAYFYRQNRNSKLDQALREEMRGELVMSPEEMVQIRERNAITPKVFLNLSQRTRAHFSASANQIDLTRYLDGYCMDQLGGDFQAKGHFEYRHVLERLERKLARKTNVDVDLALSVLSLTVFAEPLDLCSALFDALKDGSDETMSPQQFERVIQLLDDTEQLPVRVLVQETEAYPFNKYSRVDGAELARRVYPSSSAANLSREAFVELLMSSEVCVWGACWNNAAAKKKKA